jgi:hypothetical protein
MNSDLIPPSGHELQKHDQMGYREEQLQEARIMAQPNRNLQFASDEPI